MIVEGMRRWLLRETVLIEEHHKPACLFLINNGQWSVKRAKTGDTKHMRRVAERHSTTNVCVCVCALLSGSFHCWCSCSHWT